MTLFSRLAISLVLALVLCAPAARAQGHAPGTGAGAAADVLPEPLRDVGIDQRLNARLPLDLAFRDEAGRPVQLGQFFGARPVVLTFVYFDCPLLCSQVLGGIVRGLRPLDLEAGTGFEVVAVSFDPADTPARAAEERERYAARYGRDGATDGFHFLTGSEPAIQRLTEAAGFRFSRDPATGLFRHGSAVMIATADGRLSRYLGGIDFAPRDLQIALLEASEGRIASLTDRILLYCYQYDPTTGRYGLMTMRLLRIGGIGMIAALGLLIGRTWWVEGRRTRG